MLVRRWACPALLMMIVAVAVVSEASTQETPSGWAQRNASGFGDPHNTLVLALAAYRDDLYAGTLNDNGGQLWRWHNSTWQQVGAPGLGHSHNVGIEYLYPFAGQLYAGVWNEADGGELWRSPTGITWTQVISRGFGNPAHQEINWLTTFDGMLYAAAWSYTTTVGAAVWRSPTGDAGTWTQIVTDGFADPHNVAVMTLVAFGDYLYAGTYNSTTGGEVWRSDDGTHWEQVNSDGFGAVHNGVVAALALFDGQLYASTLGLQGVAGSEVWRCQLCDGSDWQQVVDNGFGNIDTRHMNGLEVLADRLYFFAGNSVTGMEVWRTADGTHWEQIGFGGLGNSDNRATYWDNGIVVFQNTLYVGTWNPVDGGEVWTYLKHRTYLPLVLRRP